MPEFRYQSLSATGQSQAGVITASDRAEAVRQLLRRGETATSVEPTAGRARSRERAKPRSRATTSLRPAALAKGPRRPNLSQAELATFVREIATAIEAGLPLMSALRTVRKQATGRAMPGILDHLIERVEAGDALYQAASSYGRPFDEMILGMLRAADASGQMDAVLHQLADLLERNVELKRDLIGATFYPMIVACLILASVVVLMTVLVPRLIEPLAQQPNFRMPLPTAIVMGAADFLRAWWLVVVVGTGVGVVVWRGWVANPANRLRVDRLKLFVPITGRLIRDVAVTRFTRTLGTLSSAGLPLLESLRITRNTLGNAALTAAIDEVLEDVTAGRALAEPLERSGLFPPLLVQVVNLGERAGRLDQMLMHAASAFDRRVNQSIKLVTKALPPLLLVVMASLGGLVLAAVLLPMLEIQALVQ